MSSTEEKKSCNIGEDNSNAPPNSESSINQQHQQEDVAAEMASSLARSAEISEDGELPRPDNNDNDEKLASSRQIASTVLSPLQRKLIADQNSRVGSSSIDNRSFGTSIEGRSIDNTTNRSAETSSIYGNSVDSYHSWNPTVSSSVASSSLGRSQLQISSEVRVEDQIQDVNNHEEECDANQNDTSTDIETGQQNNNVQLNNNIEQQQQQQPQIEEEQPQPIAISNMDQIGVAAALRRSSQSRRRITQESTNTDGTPIAIPVDMSITSQSRRSRQRVPIFNATRIDTSSNENEEEEDIADGRRKRQRQVCIVCFLIVIIGGLSVILGILLSPSRNDDNGEKDNTSEEMIQEPTTEVLSVSKSSSTEPSTQPSQSISTSLPSFQPTITTIPTEPIPTSSPINNPTQSPTQLLWYPDWSMSMCNNDPKDRPVGYSIVQGRQPLFQTLESCCNSQFWWDVNGCLLKSNGGSATTFVEQTDSPPSLNPTSPPSIIMTSLSPITLVPSVSPLQSPVSSSPTKAPTELPTQFPTNKPSSKAPTRHPITSRPTGEPSNSPSDSPVLHPTTSAPSKRPTNIPTALPTNIPTALPTTLKPTPKPSLISTSRPTKTPEKTWQPLGNEISGNGRFGHSVSLSSDAKTLAIGAPNYSDESNTNIGKVEVYTWVESTWQLGQSITGDESGVEFVSSVSLSSSGLTLAVSSPKSNTNGESSGSVSVYVWDESTSLWQQLGQTINGETAGDNFGFSLSLSPNGRTLAASSPYSNNGGLSSGSVRIFTWNTVTNEWVQFGSSINGSTLSFSGWSVSLSASRTVAIGARQSASGSVKVYTYNDDSMNWIQKGQTLTGEKSGDYFGHAVSISSNGSVMAVGAPRHDYQAGLGITNTGQVKLYEWSTSGIWKQVGQSINGIESGQQLGWSVDLSEDGNSVAVASYNPNSDNRGEVTVYERKNDSWHQVGQTIMGDGGWCHDVSLDRDGRTLVGSAPNTDSAGGVRVFHFTSEEI